MGNPCSLNLRNLVWHGFVNPGELNGSLCSCILLFLCAVIGRHLMQYQSIKTEEIILRDWTILPELPELPTDTAIDDELRFPKVVKEAKMLPAARRPILLQAFRYHRIGEYGRACVLLLPEIEHLLRLIYCSVKECPERTITAETTVHYTTLDVILHKDEAIMNSFLGQGLHTALLDVLVEPAGPRIRDRFSHGECSLIKAHSSASRFLLSIALLLLTLDVEVEPRLEYAPVFSSAAFFQRQLVTTLQVLLITYDSYVLVIR